MQELMFLSIDLSRRRVVRFPEEARQRVAGAAAAHAHLQAPDWARRHIAMPIGPASGAARS
jgi:hypothetical protein